MDAFNKASEAVIETLTARGWCFGDADQLNALIVIHSALSDDGGDASAVAASVESELLNMDLKSIGGKSLPDPIRKECHLQGLKILQISSVRDISVSTIEGFSGSSSRRLLRFGLTDGHVEITAIEYAHLSSIPNDVVPGTKVRLENRVPVHNGIVCLGPKMITLIGGIVQSLYQEWQMNQKYSGLLRSSLRLSQETNGGGPPRFEKLQIGALARYSSQRGTHSEAVSVPVQNRATCWKPLQKMNQPSQDDQCSRDRKHKGKGKQEDPQVLTLDKEIVVDCLKCTPRSKAPTAAETSRNTEIKPIDTQRNAHSVNDKVKVSFIEDGMEQKPSNSETRPKEVAESVPVQNQAAAQKLLQKMSRSTHGNQHFRGRKQGKGKLEEQQVFTLDEWEKRKPGAKPLIKNQIPDTSCDEDIAWQLQNQLDVEDSHGQRGMCNTTADDIRMSMFNYGRDAAGSYEMEHGGRGKGKGRGRGRGRGRRRGQNY